MRLTWRDAATTAVAAGLLAGYGAYTAGVDLPLVSGPRAAGGVALLAGVAMCASAVTATGFATRWSARPRRDLRPATDPSIAPAISTALDQC